PAVVAAVRRGQGRSVGEERVDEAVDLGQARCTKIAQRAPQRKHLGRRQSVHHVESALVALDESRLAQDLKMRGRVRQALSDLPRKLFDGALALTEQIEQLEAVGAGQRFADSGELGVQAILEGSVTHHRAHTQLFSRILEESTLMTRLWQGTGRPAICEAKRNPDRACCVPGTCLASTPTTPPPAGAFSTGRMPMICSPLSPPSAARPRCASRPPILPHCARASACSRSAVALAPLPSAPRRE